MQAWAWRPLASASPSPGRPRSIQSENFNWRPNVLSLSKAKRGRLSDGRLLSRKSAAQGSVTEASKLGAMTLWTLLAISSLNLMSFTAMFPITPMLMKRYSMKSEIGVGLVASSFALGRFCTTSCWPNLVGKDYHGLRALLCSMAKRGQSHGRSVAVCQDSERLHWPQEGTIHGLAGRCGWLCPAGCGHSASRLDLIGERCCSCLNHTLAIPCRKLAFKCCCRIF